MDMGSEGMRNPLLRSLLRILNSPAQIEADILFLLKENPSLEFTGADIWKLLWIGAGSLYPALIRLEKRNLIDSRWREGPYPRARLYRIKRGEVQ
jgi:DNA-binding PadR family transcriptional regulator